MIGKKNKQISLSKISVSLDQVLSFIKIIYLFFA